MAFPSRLRTVEGYNLILVALLVALAASVIKALLVGILVQTPSTDPFFFFGISPAISCLGGLALFFAAIFFLVGFSHVNSGKQEFGPGHERWVSRANWSLAATVILYFTGGIVSTGLLFSLVTAGSAGFGSPESLLPLFVVAMVFGVLLSLALALTLILPVRSFLRQDHLPFAGIAGLVLLAAPIVLYGLLLAELPNLAANPGGLNPGFLSAFSFGGAVAEGMNAFALTLILALYLVAKRRIASGEVPPIPPRPPIFFVPPYGMYPMPYYPMPYNGPPYPAAPPPLPAEPPPPPGP